MSTVLVVEDDFGVGLAVEELLVEEGFTVVRALNGQEALTCLASMQKPDVILLDLMMPVMNGPQFLKVIAQDVRYADIPVVVASANANGPLPVRAMLRKPFSAEALLNTVRRVVEPPAPVLMRAG